MRRDDLAYVTVDLRHAGELIAHPCACGHLMCTLGSHLFDSTKDMAPGPKAQSFEPPVATNHTPTDGDPRPDTTGQLHAEYQKLLTGARNAARDLTRFIDNHRPDRWTPLPEPATDDQWCRNHLDHGHCYPRYRGDLCRGCYDYGNAYGTVPDRELIEARHTKGYYADRDVKAWLLRRPPTAKTKRGKKAS